MKLSSLFSSGMVIQRNQTIKIEGFSLPEQDILLSFAGVSIYKKSDLQGFFQFQLENLSPGGPYTMKLEGDDTLTIEDIYIGDVWVLAGQSNMQLPLSRVKDYYEKELLGQNNPHIRAFLYPMDYNYQHQVDTLSTGKWVSVSEHHLMDFSAVGYFFAKELYDTYQVPIGLIQTAIGGTKIEAWMEESLLLSYPEYKKTILQNKEDPSSVDPKKSPCGLFNGMIYPLRNYTIKGVAWYQGESNTTEAHGYRKLFSSMIQDWRNLWNQGNFPFLFVQLPNFGDGQIHTINTQWAELREEQKSCLEIQNTAMAITIDIGQYDDLHPYNKKDVGLRLALCAKHLVYSEDIVYSGPLYDHMEIEDNGIRIYFHHTGKRLIAKSEPLRQFYIKGKNGPFVPAQATIEGKTVYVSSEEITQPQHVRYAWTNNPHGANLYNQEGLPASPFTTETDTPHPKKGVI